MAAIRIRRIQGLSRGERIAVGIALIAIAAYFLLLRHLDGRAEIYFRDLRENDPATYLTNLREAQGFETYLAEYAVLEGFDEFRPQTPGFLVGRWTMRESPLRLTPGQGPDVCSDPAVFEYGLYMSPEAAQTSIPVQYRLEGIDVLMRDYSDRVYPISLIAYGAQLDHLEFTPPGRKAPVYAYLCGR